MYSSRNRNRNPNEVMVTGQANLRFRPSSLERLALPNHVDSDETANPTPDQARAWLENVRPEHLSEAKLILEDNPTAFGPYLKACYLPDQPEDITAHFDSSYLGSYQTIDHWAEDFFELIGGQENLQRLQEENEWPQDLLTWNPEAAVKFSQSLGMVIEEDGGLFHAFMPTYIQVQIERENKASAALKEWEKRHHPLAQEHLPAARRLISREPHAFLAYLDRFYESQAPEILESLEEDFDSIFVGSYANPEEWALESFDALGWSEAVEETRSKAGIPDNILNFDIDKFLEWAQDSMGFVLMSRGGQIHVFQA
ncbi:hypothetical protein ACTXMG_11995 [Corynebacterium flavescens]|uniref:hypothetical protein n=1 Tax=Corynebacterium flavescens TaxID=28028 RepID=UPI003FD1A592